MDNAPMKAAIAALENLMQSEETSIRKIITLKEEIKREKELLEDTQIRKQAVLANLNAVVSAVPKTRIK